MSGVPSLTKLAETIACTPLPAVIKELNRLTKRPKIALMVVELSPPPGPDGPSPWYALVNHAVREKKRGACPDSHRQLEVATLLWQIPAARESFEREIEYPLRKFGLLDVAASRGFDSLVGWLARQGVWYRDPVRSIRVVVSDSDASKCIRAAHENAAKILRREHYLLPDLVKIVQSFFPVFSLK